MSMVVHSQIVMRSSPPINNSIILWNLPQIMSDDDTINNFLQASSLGNLIYFGSKILMQFCHRTYYRVGYTKRVPNCPISTYGQRPECQCHLLFHRNSFPYCSFKTFFKQSTVAAQLWQDPIGPVLFSQCHTLFKYTRKGVISGLHITFQCCLSDQISKCQANM